MEETLLEQMKNLMNLTNKLCCQLDPLRGCRKCNWLICKTCYISDRDNHDLKRAAEARKGIRLESFNVLEQHDAVSNHIMKYKGSNKDHDIVCYDDGLQ